MLSKKLNIFDHVILYFCKFVTNTDLFKLTHSIIPHTLLDSFEIKKNTCKIKL